LVKWLNNYQLPIPKYQMRDTRYEIIVYIDGGSRGNPGPAAAAFILTDSAGTQLQAKAFFLGRTTNNVAEYTAICKALETAKQIGAKQLTVFSDSELLVKQINGQYKVKSEQIRPLFQQSVNALGEFENWKVQHITREENADADKLVNQALNLEQDITVPCDRRPGTRTSHERQVTSGESRIKPVRLGVLISGGGTTLMNILEYIKLGRLNAEVALVISSRSTVAGVEKAKKAGLDVEIIRRNDYPDIDQFSKRIEEQLVAANVDLVIQGGWLCLWKIPARYENCVMNIHPALLPSFGGEGMWGHHVHEAVLAAGCKVSGCTVHFCTNEYDKGPIIVQRCCQVQEGDTPETLAARVFEQECIAYPQAIKLSAEGKLLVEDGKVSIEK
jgi:formyltetrahydrofolate-dependent phosphoribosylglycinamide formyltransferase